MIDLKQHIRGVPDFPKPGILFYDIGTLLAHGPAWQATVDRMTTIVETHKPELLVAIESRGFLVAAPVAARLGIGFAMIRKKGKLPGKTYRHYYQLEYGQDTLEIQEGVFTQGQRAVLCDDLLATGGTAAAAIALTREVGINVVHAAFIIELDFLQGRKKLPIGATSLVTYSE